MSNAKKDTVTFNKEVPADCRDILIQVYHALNSKGYNPVDQIIGYLASDDPTYITSSNGARSMITKVSRYALMEELVEHYIKTIEKE